MIIDINKEIYILQRVLNDMQIVENNLRREHDIDAHLLRMAKQNVERFLVEMRDYLDLKAQEK
jgi:hypothetical protein